MTLDDQAQQTYRHALIRHQGMWATLVQALDDLSLLTPHGRSARLPTIEAEFLKLHNAFTTLTPPPALLEQHIRLLHIEVAQLQAIRALREPKQE